MRFACSESVTSVAVNKKRPGTPDYAVPDDFRLEDYAGRKAWELGQDAGGPVEAHVRFRFPRSLWAERNGHGRLVAEDDDGAQLRSFRIRRRDPFLRWVLSLEGDARVEAPPDLAEAFRENLQGHRPPRLISLRWGDPSHPHVVVAGKGVCFGRWPPPWRRCTAGTRRAPMADARTAEARLERLLHVLPAAGRPDGALLSDLARDLGATPGRILEDLEEVTARVYYHPGGWPDDVSILVESDRVRVTCAAGMERPVRLSPRETLCLALALRGTAAAARLSSDQRRTGLLRRAEAHLGQGTWSEGEMPGEMAAPDRAPDPAGVRETLITAARTRRACAIAYVKAGAADARLRVIHPYVSVYGEGAWYTVGWCALQEAVRVFRMDRVLEAAPTDDTFNVPESRQATTGARGSRSPTVAWSARTGWRIPTGWWVTCSSTAPTPRSWSPRPSGASCGRWRKR